MKMVTVWGFVALSLLTTTVLARASGTDREHGQGLSDLRSVSGEWRSGEQFEHQARATLVVEEGAGGRTGTLTLRGLTDGDDDRATLRVPFRGGTWDGTTLSFVTVLPGEDDTRWALRVTAPGRAVLGPVTDDGHPMVDGPTWDMSRR